MATREYRPDQFFRACIDTMDELDDFEMYVAEYFSFKFSQHGQAVFAELGDAEQFLFQKYLEATPDQDATKRKAAWIRGSCVQSKRRVR